MKLWIKTAAYSQHWGSKWMVNQVICDNKSVTICMWISEIILSLLGIASSTSMIQWPREKLQQIDAFDSERSG